jgi:uncharacterized protein involved in response to NO
LNNPRPKNPIERLFSYGFRPLFLSAVVAAIVLVSWWIGWLRGYLVPPAGIDPVAWHTHEMLFGFVGAAIGGFLTTAVANWTKRPPIKNGWLVLLVVTWIAARITAAVETGLPFEATIIIYASYWLLLTVLMGREIYQSGNHRNHKIVAILVAFLCLELGFFFYQAEVIRAVLILICILISVIGGRIIPAFTGNWLKSQEGNDVRSPGVFNWVDQVAITFTVIFAICWSPMPDSSLTGVLGLFTGFAHLVRLSRWCGYLTFSNPLLLILHVSYGWLVIGFIAITGLILAVSSRAAFGHTNRPLVAGRLLSASFVLINLAAITRMFVVIDAPMLIVSAGCWLGAFLLFAVRVVPILLDPPAESVESS